MSDENNTNFNRDITSDKVFETIKGQYQNEFNFSGWIINDTKYGIGETYTVNKDNVNAVAYYENLAQVRWSVIIKFNGCGAKGVKFSSETLEQFEINSASSEYIGEHFVASGERIDISIDKTTFATDSETNVKCVKMNFNQTNGSGRWGQNSDVQISFSMISEPIVIEISKG